MLGKNPTVYKVSHEAKEKAEELRRKIQAIENRKVTQIKFFERLINEDFERMLKKDAELKRLKHGKL